MLIYSRFIVALMSHSGFMICVKNKLFDKEIYSSLCLEIQTLNGPHFIQLYE